MNTAESLKKCSESTYSKVRRLIIANPLLAKNTPLNRIINLNFQENENFDTNAVRWHLLDQYHPRVGESSIQLCVPQSKVNTQTSEMKNCPECSKAIFHSDYYQLIWAKRCPIHGEKLTTHCPECNQPWAPMSQLAKNDCPCCGTRYTIEQLSKNHAFDSASYNRVFGELEHIVNQHFNSSIVGYGDKNYEYELSQLDFLNDYEFPERHCVFHPEAHDLLSRMTEVEKSDYKVQNFQYIPLKTLAEQERYYERSITWGNELFEEVNNQLLIRLKEIDTPDHTHAKLDSYGEQDCPYCLAYSVWFHLSKHKIALTNNASIDPKFGKDLWRLNDSLFDRPDGATPIVYLERTLLKSESDSKGGEAETIIGVPEVVGKEIYRTALNLSFENIALFLLYRAKLTNYSSTGYLISSALCDQMPYKACPCSPHLYEVFMVERKNGTNTIDMAIPLDYTFPDAAFSPDALELLKEHQLNVPNYNPAPREVYGGGPDSIVTYHAWHREYSSQLQMSYSLVSHREEQKSGWHKAEAL